MVVYCSIIQCGARKNAKRPNLTSHRFPKNEEAFQRWLDVIGIENINPKHKDPHVCSLHFTEASYNRTYEKATLRVEAVPSLHHVHTASATSISETPGSPAKTSAAPRSAAKTSAAPRSAAKTSAAPRLTVKNFAALGAKPSSAASPDLSHTASATSISEAPGLAAKTSTAPRLAAKTSAAPRLAAKTSAEPRLAAKTSAAPRLTVKSFAALGAKPSSSASPDLSMKCVKQAETKLCRVCLAMDVKMFDMKDFKLMEMFQNVTGLSVSDEQKSILQRVCWECAARLAAAATFKNKALLSDALLKNIADMNKSHIAKLKLMYRSSFKSLLIKTGIRHEDISPTNYKIKIITDKTAFEENKQIVNLPLKTDVRSGPKAENYSSFQAEYMKSKIFSEHFHDGISNIDDCEISIDNTDVNDNNNVLNEVMTTETENDPNIQNKHTENEIFSKITDTIENSDVYCNNNDKVQSDDTVMTDAPINEDCYIVIVAGDEENIPKIDVVGNTENETLSEEGTESLEVSANKAEKVTIRKVGASSEQGNRLDDKQRIITLKEIDLLLAEISKKSDLSLSTSNFDIEDDCGVFLTQDKDQNNDGLNGTGFNEPGSDEPGSDDYGFDDYGIADTVVLNDKDDPSEEEYVLFDNKNYSSDDILPSEKCKEKADETAKLVKEIKDPTGPRKKGRSKKDGLTITDLTFEEQLAEIAKMQESSNYKKSFIKCTLCSKGFSEEDVYISHMLEHIDFQIPEDGPSCELCNVRFASSEAFQRHLSVSARHNTDKDSKEPNQRKTDRKRSARDKDGDIDGMRESKMQKVEGQIPCEQCGVELEGSWAYYIHFRREHPDKNRTKYPSMKYPCMCEVCGRFFQSQTHLTEHIWTHKDENPFRCDPCGKVFSSKRNLTLHQRGHSQERPSYECELCGRSFSNSSNRQRHMMAHGVEKPYKCEMCGKAFRFPSEKQDHVNFVHLKKPWPSRSRELLGYDTVQMELWNR